MKRHAALALFLGILVGGCASKIVVDGITVRQRYYERHLATGQNRARYELQCEQLETTLLDESYGVPASFGVDGCGHRVVYVMNAAGTFVLDTPQAPSQPPGSETERPLAPRAGTTGQAASSLSTHARPAGPTAERPDAVDGSMW